MGTRRIRLPVTVTPIEGGHAIVIDPGSLSADRPLPPPLPPQGWTDEQRAEWLRSREAKPEKTHPNRCTVCNCWLIDGALTATNQHPDDKRSEHDSTKCVGCYNVDAPGRPAPTHANMPCVLVTDIPEPECRGSRLGHAGQDGVCLLCGERFAPAPPEKWTPEEKRELERRRRLADEASAVTAKKAREEEELRERMREQDAASAADRARKKRDERREKAKKAELIEELQEADATISELRESLANEQSEARDVVEAHRQTHETYRLLGATLEAVREKLEELIEAYADRAPFDDRALFEARLALHDVENALDSDPGHPEPNDED